MKENTSLSNFSVPKNVIITEKPSVAREFVKYICPNAVKKDGYYENESWVVTWAVGHLVAMSYPEVYDAALKRWSIDPLPFIPEKYLYEIIPNVSAQYNVIKNIYNRLVPGSTIYYAGDPAREGLYIQMLIRQEAGIAKGVNEKVVWIDSQTEEEIKKGIRDAKPLSDPKYQQLKASGYSRAKEDYLIGINFSRLLSLKYSNMINTAAGLTGTNRKPISVGRVMTCVLGMVVQREIEIKNFTVTPFYKIISSIDVNGQMVEAEWKAEEESCMYNSPKLYNENGFKEEADAIDFISKLQKPIMVKDISVKQEKKSAPPLFNLTELQFECSKKLKISPDETLQIAQSLYEKKMTTYPRTSARVLSTAVAKVIENNIKGLSGYGGVITAVVQDILAKGSYKTIASSKYTDDSKVVDHYALIPTGQGLNQIASLTQREKQVYDIVVRRFLSIFMPPAIYEKISLEETAGTEHFYGSAKVLVSPGYLEVAGYDEEKNKESLLNATAMKSLKKGSLYNYTTGIKKGETTPPKRYTSGSLVLAMENAGNLIEDDDLRAQIKDSGIGTDATRAETLKKLEKIEYIRVDKKTQGVYPDTLGYMVYEVVKQSQPALLSPKMTASWEKGLDGVANGTVTEAQFMDKLNNYVRKQSLIIKATDFTEEINKAITPYRVSTVRKSSGSGGTITKQTINAKCPLCGSQIITTPFGYGCSSYDKSNPSSCRFMIGEICGKTLTESQVIQLLSKGKTNKIKGFKSKAGKDFDAALKWENGKITFEFSNK